MFPMVSFLHCSSAKVGIKDEVFIPKGWFWCGGDQKRELIGQEEDRSIPL